MEFRSILDKVESTYRNRRKPEFIQDLNLDRIIEKIQFQWGEDIAAYYRYFPENKECEIYRREVFADVKKESVYAVLENYVNQMREWNKAKQNKGEVEMDMQAEVWHLWEVYHYCMSYEQLYQQLKQKEPASEGFAGFLDYLRQYLQEEAFRQMKDRACNLIEQLKNFRIVLTLENNQIVISQEELPANYETFLKESFPGNSNKLRSPFAGSLNMSNLEMELLGVFRKKNTAFFKEVSRFYKDYSQYADEVLLRFHKEIGFYLAFYRFEKNMKEEGFSFAIPTVDDSRDMYATQLYDLALAIANYRYDKPVIANDFVYHDGEKIFVVTGPNQGGKTTFARSLGQLVYFTKMGLDVPANAANVKYFSDILTHFSVEESVETGCGKLKEELNRLAPMMNAVFDNAFVIINELFTTAANYDACIMGKRVLEHFLKQNCHGVYVTHLKELSEAAQGVVSMKALVEHQEVPVENTAAEQSPAGQKTKSIYVRKFIIIRSEAEDMGYSGDLVDKHRLTYEQIKDRLGFGR